MKVFAVLALLPFVTAAPDHAPHGYHPAPVHHGYGYPKYQPEIPKHNCSVLEVAEISQVCTPSILTACNKNTLPIKIIEEAPFTYVTTRSVCTETIEIVNFDVCKYTYEDIEVETTGKTVEISFEKVEKVQMVTVCQPVPTYPAYGYGPAPGYGHHFGKRSADAPAHAPAPHGHGYGYGKHCKEVAQTTTYQVPKATVVEPPLIVVHPEPKQICEEKTIELPVIQCAELEEEKTIMVPNVVDSEVEIEKCVSVLGAPDCKGVELTLPKQVCKELNFGHADETVDYAKPEPAYAPAPAPAYAPAPHA